MKILTFLGILASHSFLFGLFISKLNRCLYIDLTEKMQHFPMSIWPRIECGKLLAWTT
jgi:hypothetical protein